MIPSRLLRIVVALGVALLLTACASGYSQFYRPWPGATPDLVASLRVAPPSGQPLVERVEQIGQDSTELLDAYARRGYAPIGTSLFNSGNTESEDRAIEQGRRIGADLVVIMSPRHTGSTTATIPMTIPTSSTSYSTGTATAYGAAGTVRVYGTGTTTTLSTSTTMIPITISRTDYGAGYFVKRKWSFGGIWRDLNDSERQELQSNKGLYLKVVVDNSPAYNADILPGDIVLAIDGEPVSSQEAFSAQVSARSGRNVLISLYRRGSRLEKSVKLLKE